MKLLVANTSATGHLIQPRLSPCKAWIENCNDSAHYAAWIWGLAKISLHRFNVARSCEPRHLFKQSIRMIPNIPGLQISSIPSSNRKWILTPSDLETLWHSHIPHLCCCFCRHLGWCHLHCLCCSSRLCCLYSCCCLHCLGGMHSSLGRGLGGLCGCCLKWVKGRLNCPYSALCSFTCIRWPLGFLVFFFISTTFVHNKTHFARRF